MSAHECTLVSTHLSLTGTLTPWALTTDSLNTLLASGSPSQTLKTHRDAHTYTQANHTRLTGVSSRHSDKEHPSRNRHTTYLTAQIQETQLKETGSLRTGQGPEEETTLRSQQTLLISFKWRKEDGGDVSGGGGEVGHF